MHKDYNVKIQVVGRIKIIMILQSYLKLIFNRSVTCINYVNFATDLIHIDLMQQINIYDYSFKTAKGENIFKLTITYWL